MNNRKENEKLYLNGGIKMKTSINTKKIMINSMLLAIGALLHAITPTLGLPMQPDFALIMLFIIIVLNNGEYKASIAAAIVTGILTAMTTKFPGGQLPNVIDKVVTGNAVLLIIFMINKISLIKTINERKKQLIIIGIIMPIGTLISGSTFLYSALLIVGLPAPFMALFLTVVIPAVIINTIAGVFLTKVIDMSLKRVISLQ